MLGWWRELSRSERSTFWACFGGWALDAMDVQIYSFVIPALIASWHVTSGEAGILATSSLLFSAAGGWIAGLVADRIGRVRTLQVTILCFAVFTSLCGLAQGYAQMLVARALVGLGFGGEWAAGAVLIGETVQPRHRGKTVGVVQSGWAVGWGVAALLYAVLFTWVPERLAWRALFFVGVTPALLVLYIRRRVEEPAVFRERRDRATERPATANPLGIFSPPLMRTTVLTALLATGAQGGYYALTTWLPTYLKTELRLSVVGTSAHLAAVIAGAFAGYLVGAWLSDRLGRRRTFFVFSLGALATALAYTQLGVTDRLSLFIGFPLGFFASGVFSGMGAFFTELFPTPMRGSGQGFSYSFGRGIGALFPTLVGYLGAALPLGRAIGIFAAAAYALLFVAAFLLPETRGADLGAVAPAPRGS